MEAYKELNEPSMSSLSTWMKTSIGFSTASLGVCWVFFTREKSLDENSIVGSKLKGDRDRNSCFNSLRWDTIILTSDFK